MEKDKKKEEKKELTSSEKKIKCRKICRELRSTGVMLAGLFSCERR